MPNLLVAGNSTNGGTAITTDTSGTLNIVTGSGSGTTAVTVDGSGNVVVTGTLTASGGVAGSIGVGQTWTNVTGSRALSTTYTNSTGKPIQLYIVCTAGNANGAYITISGTSPSQVYTNVAGGRAALFAIIPNGITYALGDASATIQSWWELR